MTTAATIVLVTGANKGIGYSIIQSVLRASAGAPYHAILCSRSAENGKAAFEMIKAEATNGNSVSLLELDVTSEAVVSKAAATVASQFGRLDILVNNAGVAFFNSDAQALRDTLEVNLVGPYRVTQAFKELLLTQPSTGPAKTKRLIHVSSSLGSVALKRDPPDENHKRSMAPAYSISKAGLNMMAACHEREFGDKVKVFSWNPKYTITELGGAHTVPIRKAHGGIPADEAGEACLEVIDGSRDQDAGRLIEEGAVLPW